VVKAAAIGIGKPWNEQVKGSKGVKHCGIQVLAFLSAGVLAS
jgi:hypothetical protein